MQFRIANHYIISLSYINFLINQITQRLNQNYYNVGSFTIFLLKQLVKKFGRSSTSKTNTQTTEIWLMLCSLQDQKYKVTHCCYRIYIKCVTHNWSNELVTSQKSLWMQSPRSACRKSHPSVHEMFLLYLVLSHSLSTNCTRLITVCYESSFFGTSFQTSFTNDCPEHFYTE